MKARAGTELKRLETERIAELLMTRKRLRATIEDELDTVSLSVPKLG